MLWFQSCLVLYPIRSLGYNPTLFSVTVAASSDTISTRSVSLNTQLNQVLTWFSLETVAFN